jgi:opacity protein-like surface antigen
MKKSRLASIMLLSLALLFGEEVVAQTTEYVNFSGGAGFSVPIEDAGRNLNTGWNLGFRGGYNLSSHWAADLDFGYSHWGLNSAALARYGEPNGSSGIWSLTFNPVYHFAPHSRMNPYVTSGFGLYHRNLTLTRPVVVNTLVCDFFFGFCFPAAVGVNQVVASSSTYKGGYNAGGGIEIPVGSKRLKIFGEARYQRMFTTHASDLTYLPVTFGLRW